MMTEQQYLLTCLAEECCEVAKQALKSARFGLGTAEPGQPLNNFDRLEHELNDLMGVAAMLALRCRPEAMTDKQLKLRTYLERSRHLGQVEPGG